MLMLALKTKPARLSRRCAGGKWQLSKQLCLLTRELHDINGSTLGIVGYGSIGKSMARLGESVGMRVLNLRTQKREYDSRRPHIVLPKSYGKSDVISLHCPLTAKTENMIGRAEFKSMKAQRAANQHCARRAGPKDAALIEALQEGLIAGAGVDVLREEPPVNSSPLLELDMPNFHRHAACGMGQQ
jgi:glycerate dehydrogenase